MHAVEGIMGHFVPAIPVSINELNAFVVIGIHWVICGLIEIDVVVGD